MRTDLGDVAVLDAGGLVQMFPLDPLGGEAAAGDGRPAAEGLELGVHNLAVVVDLNLLTNKSTGGMNYYGIKLHNFFLTHISQDI